MRWNLEIGEEWTCMVLLVIYESIGVGIRIHNILAASSLGSDIIILFCRVTLDILFQNSHF
jgi:polysaccharide pyruvyl transferase WcaK-like protein